MYDPNDPVSRYYDLAFSSSSDLEENYFVDFANETTGPIVDLCCGTGTLSLKIATENKRVFAVDRSRSMLENLKKNKTEAQQIEIIESDMASFTLPETVGRLICRDAFFHCLTPDEQRSTLLRINDSLEPGGVAAFNIHVPNPNFLTFAGSVQGHEFSERGRWIIPKSQNQLVISQSLDINYYTQRIRTRLKFETLDEGGIRLSEEFSGWETRYTFPYELFYLLEITGFKLRNVYGHYDKSAWSDKSMLIVEAEKFS